ncbi:MAG: PqqD family protein [Terriglobales bacterium]
MSKLSLSLQVKPSEDVVWRNLQGESVLLDLKSGVYFGLDVVGTRIWTLLQDHSDLQAVLQELLAEYEVNEETCAHDLMDLVSAMAEKGLVQTEPCP